MPVSHDFCTVPATPQDITAFTLASAVIGYKVPVWVKLDVDTMNRILSLAELEVFGKGLHALYGHTISYDIIVDGCTGIPHQNVVRRETNWKSRCSNLSQ